MVRVYLPLYFAQSIFAHIGATSIHQLVLEAFDDLEFDSPEALGAACVLIRNRPPGWSERLRKFMDATIRPREDSPIKYFLLSALHEEYYFHYLTPDDLAAMEVHIAYLLNKAGFRNERARDILARIERDRPRKELFARELRR